MSGERDECGLENDRCPGKSAADLVSLLENDNVQTIRSLLIFSWAEPVTEICSLVNFMTFRKPCDKITLATMVAAAMQISRMMICEFFASYFPS